MSKEAAAVTIQGIKTLGEISEAVIDAIVDDRVEMHKATQSNALMGIVDSIITASFYRKIGVIDAQDQMTIISTISALLNLNIATQKVAFAGQVIDLLTLGIAGGGAVAAGLAENILIPKLTVRTDIKFGGAKGLGQSVLTQFGEIGVETQKEIAGATIAALKTPQPALEAAA